MERIEEKTGIELRCKEIGINKVEVRRYDTKTEQEVPGSKPFEVLIFSEGQINAIRRAQEKYGCN